jgi:AraC-like DNA-binding protein
MNKNKKKHNFLCFFNQFNSSKFLKKMLMLYITTSSLVFFVLFIMIYTLISNNYLESINEANNKKLKEISNTFENLMENIYNYYYINAMEDSNLIFLLSASDFNTEVSLACNKISRRLLDYSNLVDSFYLINYKGDFVCSNYDTSKDIDSFFDQNIINILNTNFYNENISSCIPRAVSYDLYGIHHDEKYISIIFRKFTNGVLVINLNQNKLSKMINSVDLNTKTQTLILNSSGYVLADSNESLFASDYSSYELYGKILSQGRLQGNFIFSNNNKRQNINFLFNDLFNTSYIIITDVDLFYFGNPLMQKIIFYLMVSIFISFWLSLVASYILYRPIRNLKEITGATVNKNQFIDEFDYFTETFIDIKNRYLTEKKTLENYFKNSRSQKLKDLLEDRIKELNFFLYEFENYNISFKEKYFFVAVINFESYEELINNGENIKLVKYAINNILYDVIPKSYLFEIVDFSSYLACIINFSLQKEKIKSASEINEINYAFEKLKEAMLLHFDIVLNICVGNIVANLFEISESFKNALIAFRYQIYNKADNILYFDLIDIPKEYKYYPCEIEKNIVDAIKTGDEKKLRNSVSEFFKFIITCSYNETIAYLATLYVNLENYAQKCNLDNGDVFSELSLHTIQNEKLYKLEELFKRKCDQYLCQMQETKNNDAKKNQIVLKVIEIIEKNLSNPMLSIEFIASEVNFSTSYLRLIFKETMGTTISKIIIDKRIEKICALLNQSNMSVQKIADELGFSSPNYLYAFFKNYTGLTPNQYRKQQIDKNALKRF